MARNLVNIHMPFLRASLALSALLLLTSAAAHPASGSTAACMPFVGEHMEFSVGWEFINAGTAVIQVASPQDNVYRTHIMAKTNAFLDMFKKVRDEITAEGRCNNGNLQSTLFELKQLEVKYRANKKTEFFWPEGKVHYTQNDRTDIYDVEPHEVDVMDAFFAVRSMPLKPGDTFNIAVFDSRKNYKIVVNVLKIERLRAPWRKWVECLVIEPKLKTEGIFSSRGQIKVWMTNDERHIPIKMTAKIRFGRIVAKLTGYRKDS